MNAFEQNRLEKAEVALAGARRDLAAGDPDLAADRAYYVMFYVAEALLSHRGLSFSSHGAVHGAFGKEFAKTAELDAKFHRWLLDAFRLRQAAVYDHEAVVDEAAAVELIAQAEQFLTAARTYLDR